MFLTALFLLKKYKIITKGDENRTIQLFLYKINLKLKAMRLVSIVFIVCLWVSTMNAQNLSKIMLPAPTADRGASVMKALAERQSRRAFSSKAISLADLSDLLWAANGVNRPADGKRTAPSALNKQDIDVYVFTPEGVYLYDAVQHVLNPIAVGDQRDAVAGGQDFVKQAPVCLVYVSDLSRFGMGNTEQVKLMAAMDAGIVSENVNLFCAGVGLATVPRASMDQAALKKILKLSGSQLPLMNNPVGHPVD